MMNKTVLMLSVSCMPFIAGADLCYAGFNPYDMPPELNSAMLNSRNSTHTSHLTAGHLSSLEDFNKGDNKLVQLAAACFVTDTTDCSGNEFVGNNADDDNGGVPPGGSENGDGDDYELDNEKRCEEEGYTMTNCPEDSDPVNFCPYDSTYFEKCKANCPSDYVTCEPPYHGVGEACGDKYASCECTPCGAGYDYTTIPEGYVQDGEACLDCDGKTKYKIKPNPCDGYLDCGSAGPEAGANTCQSGTEIKYDNCKPCANECSMDSCPFPYLCKQEECSNKYCKTGCQPNLGYVWNTNSETCSCDSIYQYTCSGTGYAGGEGASCDGKYYACNCAAGYVWINGQCIKDCEPGYIMQNGQCVCDTSIYAYTCTGANESPSGSSCGGKYQSCSCPTNYTWMNGKCLSDICPAGTERHIKFSMLYNLTQTATTEAGSGCYTKEPKNHCATGSEIGYLLYKDMSRAPIENYEFQPNNTPIGLVICSYAEGGGQALALDYIPSTKWTRDYTSAVENPANLPLISDIDEALTDLESCNNTAALTAVGDRDTYYAAWQAKEFHPYIAPETKGKWCLPAAGVMAFAIYTFSEVKDELEDKNISVHAGFIGDAMWTSTLAYTNSAWGGHKNEGATALENFFQTETINDYGQVNPVIEF